VLAGEEAKSAPREQTVVYRLARHGGKWKVTAPQLKPHVSPEVALKLLDGLEHNEYVRPDLDKIRASREIVSTMAGAKTEP
jgi:hypothetical protein